MNRNSYRRFHSICASLTSNNDFDIFQGAESNSDKHSSALMEDTSKFAKSPTPPTNNHKTIINNRKHFKKFHELSFWSDAKVIIRVHLEQMPNKQPYPSTIGFDATENGRGAASGELEDHFFEVQRPKPATAENGKGQAWGVPPHPRTGLIEKIRTAEV